MATRGNVWMQCVFIMCAVTGVSCVQMWMTPRHAVVRPGDNLHVTCRTPPGYSLESCKFFITGMPAIDFSFGRDSEETEEYRYYGKGLNRGHCGINLLQVASECTDISRIVTITCAGKVTGYGWSANYMSALISNVRTFPLTMERPQILAEPGANVSIQCNTAGVPLKSCFFQGKNLGHIDLSQGTKQPPVVVGGSPEMHGRVMYFGEGLEEGDCGISISGVRDNLNGLVWCAAKSDYGHWGYDYTALLVAKPPSTPTLKLNRQALKVGETLNASCVVKDFRPSVNITWEPPFDEDIAVVHSNDLLDARLNFEEQTIVQRSVKKVVETDHMKVVRCTAEYNDNKNEVTAQQELKVRFCGKRNFKGAKPLVYGGSLAHNGEFPWHAALYLKKNHTHQYICGGSLISAKHVITAAHCVWNRTLSRAATASSYGVALGKFNIDWKEQEGAQKFDLVKLEVHKRYTDLVRHFEDDIALLILSGNVIFSSEVHPICLDWNLAVEDTLLVGGNFGVVPGWGLTEHGNLSSTLRYAELPYLEDTQCVHIIPQEFRRYLAPAKYCAGYTNQSVAVCGGDSGGGMVYYQNMTMQYYLMGLVSLAPKSKPFECNAEQVAVFTLVSDYLPWIKGILNEDDTTHVLESTT